MEEYSKVRNKDAEAICDMSMDNYLEVHYTNCGVKPIITITDNRRTLTRID